MRLKNILAIVDFRQKEHYALPRAIDLARQCNSKVTVVSCIHQKSIEVGSFLSSEDKSVLQNDYMSHYKSELEALVESAKQDGMEITCEVIWNKSFYKGLSDYLKDKDFDLLVKTSHTHSTLDKLLMTPTDWHLMRETHFNILLVKDGRWPSSGNILCSVNIEAEDKEHDSLNQKILKAGVTLSKACKSEIHLLNVFPWPLIDVTQFKHLFDEPGYYDEMLALHKKELKSYVQRFEIPEQHIHLAEGLDPEEIIPDIVDATKSQLLIIGTVGRKGLTGSLLGNTAEKILDNLHCEVLALRP